VEAGKADGVLKITRPQPKPAGLKSSAPAIVQWRHNASMNRAYDEFCGDVATEKRDSLLFSAKNVVFPAVVTRDNVKSTFDNSAAGAPLFPFANTQQVSIGSGWSPFGGFLDGLLVLSIR